jgi:hypothetical protein
MVTATFYESTPAHPAAGKSDQIIPIGAVSSNSGAEVSVPPSYSVSPMPPPSRPRSPPRILMPPAPP